MRHAHVDAMALAILYAIAFVGPALPGEAPAAPPAADKLIALNLENASIEAVMKFLSEHTGKAALKHKDAQGTITLVLSKKVPADEAVRLVCEALRLQGLAIIESDQALHIVPLEKAKELVLAPAVEPTVEPTLARGRIVTAVIPLQHAKADQLKNQFAPLLPKHVALAADERTNLLVVMAPVEEVEHIKKIVTQLDMPDTAEMEVRVFELKHADAAAVADILNQLFGTAMPGAPGAGQQPGRPPQPVRMSPEGAQPGQPPRVAPASKEPVPKIAADPRTNWVIVTATPARLKEIAELIQKLDTERPKEVDVKVYPVKHADASSLVKQVEDLFSKGPRGKALKDAVQVTAHPRGNAILAIASAENHELIRKIVEAFDTEEAQATEARTFELKHADAEDVADQLDDLYKEELGLGWYYGPYGPQRMEQGPRVRVIGVRRTNAVVVVAPPAEFKRIEGLIQELDREVKGEYLPPKVYQIRSTDATELEKALNDIFEKETTRDRQSGYYFFLRQRAKEGARDISRLAGKVRFVAEKNTNRLVVIAQSAAVLQIVDELIKGLDAVDAEYANTTVYQLKHAKAKEMADRLNELFGEAVRMPQPQQQPQKPGEQPPQQPFYWWMAGVSPKGKEEERPVSALIGRVRVVADVRTNALLIATSSQYLPSIVQLIESIDRPEPKVLIQARLLEVTREDSVREGVRFSPDAATFAAEDLDNAALGLSSFKFNRTRDRTETSGGTTTATGCVIDAQTNVNVLIQALLRNTNARLLSDPTVAVNNNEKAEIFVGSDVPKITNSQRTPEGTRNDAFEYQDVGVRLIVTPHINVTGDVVLTINLKSSQMRPDQVILGGFIFDRREYTTELVVGDHQTMVMGGILKEETSETLRKVPFLGDVPFLSALFRKEDRLVRKTELIAFITPTVLKTAADADAVTKRDLERVGKLREGDFPKDTQPPEKARTPTP